MHPAERDLAISATLKQGKMCVIFMVACGCASMLAGPLGAAMLSVFDAYGLSTQATILRYGIGMAKFSPSVWCLAKAWGHYVHLYDALDNWRRLRRIASRQPALEERLLGLQKALREVAEWDFDLRDRPQMDLDAAKEFASAELRGRENAVARLLVLANEDPVLWKEGK